MINQGVDSTVVISDIRNFTGTFEKYQLSKDNSFLDFMDAYYDTSIKIANDISRDKLHVGTTGDGILAIFIGKYHYIDGYIYSLVMYRIFTKMCQDFKRKYGDDISFGIGIDSGAVWKRNSTYGDHKIYTYLGTVINRVARIESTTKQFYYTNMAVGGNVYLHLVKEVFTPKYKILKKHSHGYDKILIEDPGLVAISNTFLICYVFELVLKGISNPVPIFRLSPHLALNDKEFLSVISIFRKDFLTYIQKLL